MMRVLLYGYATRVCSSRKREAKTHDEASFRYLSADAHPDHDTFAEFRKRQLEAMARLFTQALLLCEKGLWCNWPWLVGYIDLSGVECQW